MIARRITRWLWCLLVAGFGLILLLACQPAPPAITYSQAGEIEDPAITHVQNTSRHTLREGWFQDGEQTLHFVEAGSGPLLLLYHGFPSYWLSWQDQIEEFADDYRVIAVDGPGAGLSSKPDSLEPYRVESLASQIDRLAEALAPGERFVLVGHDWGAPLAFAYAQAFPDRLHGVIGMSAPPYNTMLSVMADSPEQQAASDYMQRFGDITFEQIKADGIAGRVAQDSYAKLIEDGEINATEAALFRASVGRPEAVHGGMNWYRANIPPWDEIAETNLWPGTDVRLKIPSLFIWGEADPIFLPSTIDAVMNKEPSLRIARLPGVSHWTSMEQPHLANAAIQDFLSELDEL